MSTSSLRSGHDWLTHPIGLLGLVVTMAALIGLGFKVGADKTIQLSILIYVIPMVLVVFRYPVVSIYLLLLLCFGANGISRYIPAQWGLMIDATLVLGWVATLARRFPRNWDTDGDPRTWEELKEDGFVLSLLWFMFILVELGNPDASSREAWFYAMRNMGFYQVLAVGLAYFHIRTRGQLKFMLHVIFGISVVAALWGIRQKYFWIDAAEEHWLYAEEHATQHILFGELRTFSFYSDAGQFGASQAMMFLMAGIMALKPSSERARVFYIITAILCFVGFGISGTRGALAVPAAGGLMYLVVSRNMKILILGLVVMIGTFSILRYTSMFSGIQQVQRMRTALDPNEPSLMVRIRNQEFLGSQLADKPLGAGIGSSGFWGNRFSPNTVFAQTATDSYYVRVWVETGIIGLSLHLLMLGFFLGAGGYRVWHTTDPVLKHQRAALLCGYAGMLFASYGNGVFNQFPTALIICLALPVILSDHWNRLSEEQI
ncbi:MAG: O-antigen ligase family protein [Saprospiraceae bacterium]